MDKQVCSLCLFIHLHPRSLFSIYFSSQRHTHYISKEKQQHSDSSTDRMQLSTLLPTVVLLLASSSNFVSAHFRLDYPISLGFDEDTEPEYPCGGSPIRFADNDTSVPVDSFPIALLSTHATGNFSYRAALGQQEPFQWVELLAVSENGLGNFCLPNLRAPAAYAGSSGLIQVVGQLGDGDLYQVSFLERSRKTLY